MCEENKLELEKNDCQLKCFAVKQSTSEGCRRAVTQPFRMKLVTTESPVAEITNISNRDTVNSTSRNKLEVNMEISESYLPQNENLVSLATEQHLFNKSPSSKRLITSIGM